MQFMQTMPPICKFCTGKFADACCGSLGRLWVQVTDSEAAAATVRLCPGLCSDSASSTACGPCSAVCLCQVQLASSVSESRDCFNESWDSEPEACQLLTQLTSRLRLAPARRRPDDSNWVRPWPWRRPWLPACQPGWVTWHWQAAAGGWVSRIRLPGQPSLP